MRSRATILTALVLCVCMASGAMAGDPHAADFTFEPSTLDTTFGEMTQTFTPFSVRGADELSCAIVRVRQDSAHYTDSVAFYLETKTDDVDDTAWAVVYQVIDTDSLPASTTWYKKNIFLPFNDSNKVVYQWLRWRVRVGPDTMLGPDPFDTDTSTISWSGKYEIHNTLRSR
jgi:hypothetical protein